MFNGIRGTYRHHNFTLLTTAQAGQRLQVRDTVDYTIVIETLENRLNSYVELGEFLGKELRKSLSCGLTRAELEAGFTQFLTQKSTPLSR